MSKQVRFYANKEDLETSMKNLREKLSVKFLDAWIHGSREIPEFNDLSDWDDLGINKTGKSVGAGFFLVLPRSEKVNPKEIHMKDGSTKYKVEPLLNPASIVLQPSGLYHDENGADYLIVGTFGTALNNQDSLGLFKAFKKLFLKGYQFVDGQYYIGPSTQKLEAANLVELWR